MAKSERLGGEQQSKTETDKVLEAGGRIVEIAAAQPPAPGSPEAMAIIRRMREGSSKPGNFRIGKSRSGLPQDRSEAFFGDFDRPQ